MQNNTLGLISGAYTSVLWEGLEEVLSHEDTPAHIYNVLKTLHGNGKDIVAFSFVRILYDIVGLTIPNVVEELAGDDESRSAYIMELLADIESII